jgi:hypothetical protein
MLYHHCFLTLLWNTPLTEFRRRDFNEVGHISFWSMPMMEIHWTKT